MQDRGILVEAIADLGRAALTGADMAQVMDTACAALARALGADLVAVLEDAPDGLLLRAGVGWEDGAVGGAMSPRTASLAGWTLETGEAVVIGDLEAETRFPVSRALRLARVASALAVPIRGAARPYGVLGVFSRTPHAFAPDDLTFARLVANTLGAALEAQRANAMARDREGVLAELVQHGPDIVIRFDRELRHVYASPAVERATGYPPEHLVGKTNRELGMPREVCELWERELLPMFEHGRAHRFAFEVVGPDGTLRHYETHAVPERGPSGAFESVVVFTRDRTEARTAELELLASQQRYEELFQSAMDMILILDTDRSVLDINPAAERALGYTRDELVGKDVSTIVPDDAMDTALHRFQRKLDGTAPASEYEGVVQTKDGRVIPIHTTTQIILRDGEPAGVLAIARDISRELEVRAALIESERRFRSAFDDAAVGMMLTSPGGTIERANASLARMLGYANHELAGKSITDITHPDDVDATRALIEELVDGSRRGFVVDKRYIRSDGELVEGHVAVSAVRDGDGAVRHFVSQVEDVTELRRVQRTLAETQALQSAVIESSRDLITVLDLEGRLRLVSDSARDMLGYEPAEVIGGLMTDFVHPDDRAEVETALRAALAGERAPRTSARVRRQDGAYTMLEGAVSAGLGDDGKPAFLVTTSRDVTERLRFEERLRQSEKLEAIGKLAGGIAHDFNNLLTVINGYSDTALRRLEHGDETVRSHIAEIRRAGDRAAELTRRLLAFSRQQALRPEALDLNDVIASSELILRRLLGEDVRVVVSLDGAIPAAFADAGQLVQIVLNLAVNARDALPRGGEIRIETSAVSLRAAEARQLDVHPGRYVRLTVSDDGEGIASGDLARIFEPFFTTKEPGHGTGLGLSTVHGIARQLGGTVTCTSQPGAGATFTVYLPATDEDAVSPLVERPASGGSERVLLVEDEAIIREVVELMLTELGYGVVATGSALEALELVESGGKFDLVLTDVVMPEMNGRELAERLANVTPNLRVVYTSGYTGDVVLSRGVLSEDDMFLQKPFTMPELDARIREALAARCP